MMFRSTAEARTLGAPVVRLFVTGLARSPVFAELAPLVERLRAGDDLGDAAVAMAASPEFLNRHGPDGPPDADYIRALFWAIDGQDPPDAERDRLLAQINPSRASLLAQVSQSATARTAITLEQHYYGGVLRPDDDVCYGLWLDGGGEQLLAGEDPVPPLVVSIVVWPVPARPDLLAETLRSLAAQTSPHWEVLVLDRPCVDAAETDRRVRFLDPAHAHATSPHSAASRTEWLNHAAAVATGTLIGFIDASDQLAPNCVEAIGRLATARAGLCLVFTDEDSIAGDGTRSAVLLKGGWSPDLLLSGDALGQLVLFDRAALLDAGGLASGAGEFALFDAALRLAEAAPDGAVHQPGILFHRGRAHGGRRAPFPRTRAGHGVAALDAVIDRHLARAQPGLSRGTRQSGNDCWPAVVASLPDPVPLVTAIILTKDKSALLQNCLSGLLDETDYPRLEVLVVDNGSTEPDTLALLDRVSADPRVRVLRAPGPFNWSALNNLAAREATGDVLVLLNNDVSVVQPGWLRSMAGHAIRRDIGVVGARLLFPDGTLQHGGVLLGPMGAAFHALTGAAATEPGYMAQVAVLRDLSAVTGACLAIRRTVFVELGGLEQDNLRVAWGDIELCLRAREAGYRVLWDPAATLVHHEMATRGRDVSIEQQARHETERAYMRRRWPGVMNSDPFLNPALSSHPLALRMPVSAGSDGRGLIGEAEYEMAALKQALGRSRQAADRLRGLWPRAELQRLRLDLAMQTQAHADASQQAALLSARVAGVPQPVIDLARRLVPLRHLGRLMRRAIGIVRRTPQRRVLLRQRRADYAVIAASPVFNRAWYRAMAMGNDQATDPVAHYLWKGAPFGREPHVLFDSPWYAARTPALGLENPFAHYLRQGMAANQDPHPLFDVPFYLAQSPEAAGRALAHFSELPPCDSRSPVPLFDPAINPEGLAHWIHTDAAADRDPHPLFAMAWYRRAHMRGASGRNPLAHWVREGAALSLPTNPNGLDPARPLRLQAAEPNPAATILLERGGTPIDTARSLHAIAQHTAASYEVVLLDPEPTPVLPDHVGVAPTLQAGVARARGRSLLLLGAGAIVQPGWLDPLLDTLAADGTAAVVCSMTLRPDGALRSIGLTVAPDGQVSCSAAGDDPARPRNAYSRPVDAPDPAAMLIRREAWDRVGLNHGFSTATATFADFAFSLRGLGWRTLVQPASVVSVPAGLDTGEDAARLGQRWMTDLADPHRLGLTRRVLVLVDALPPGETPEGEALASLATPGTQLTVHATGEPTREAAALWERQGIEVVRNPMLLDEWLSEYGASVDEVRSFRSPDTVPMATLRRLTGAPVITSTPGTPALGWHDAPDDDAGMALAQARAAA